MDKVTVTEIKAALAGDQGRLDGIFIRLDLGHQGGHVIKITRKALREIIEPLECEGDWIEGRFCGERGGRDLYLMGA
jgi:hypothetical protein